MQKHPPTPNITTAFLFKSPSISPYIIVSLPLSHHEPPPPPPPPPFRAFHPWQPTANPSMLPQPSASCPHSTPAILASALAPASLAIKSNPAAVCTCSR